MAAPALRSSPEAAISTDVTLQTSIDRAIAHYQAIVDLETGRVVGAEALCRIPDEHGDVQSPGKLIDEIERNIDTAESLVETILRSIARDARPLFDRHRDFYISVNVPPMILGSGRLGAIFEALGLAAHANRFVLELTERQAIGDQGRLALQTARGLGVRVAIDDFGTGHSGIKQLIGLPLDILKIDKSQVDPLMKDPTADRLLRGVVALASAMRVKVVAEGVESREQALFLRAAGVDSGQGWLWSRAVPADALEQMLKTGFADKTGWIVGASGS